MLVKTIRDEDYSSYKEVSMMIAFPTCSFKCCTDINRAIAMCQNSPIARLPSIEIAVDEIYKRYQRNVITHSVVCGGLEPLDSFKDLFRLLLEFRCYRNCLDTFVIYTGYTEKEVKKQVDVLAGYFSNIIMKYGRYVPAQTSHFDELLGVTLASPNQYAKRIS